MSSTYKKVTYESEGPWASTETRTIFARFNATSDAVTVYDQDGDVIFSFGEWGETDMGQALVKLLTNDAGLEDPTPEDLEMLRNKQDTDKYLVISGNEFGIEMGEDEPFAVGRKLAEEAYAVLLESYGCAAMYKVEPNGMKRIKMEGEF